MSSVLEKVRAPAHSEGHCKWAGWVWLRRLCQSASAPGVASVLTVISSNAWPCQPARLRRSSGMLSRHTAQRVDQATTITTLPRRLARSTGLPDSVTPLSTAGRTGWAALLPAVAAVAAGTAPAPSTTAHTSPGTARARRQWRAENKRGKRDKRERVIGQPR